MNATWETAKDPCNIELGIGWRIPTSTEWNSVMSSWFYFNNTYNSVLKIHASGKMNSIDGTLSNRGTNGIYWSSTQDGAANASSLYLSISSYSSSNYTKSFGFSVRCIKD